MNELQKVVLFRVDSEKGEGVDLASQYSIKGYPTFVVLNSDGKTVDRWMGYSKDYFIETMNKAIADLSTIDEKMARLEASPNLSDAVVLGRYNSSIGEYGKAVEYYSQAQQLAADSEDFSNDIFTNTVWGISRGQFGYEDAAAAYDVVLAGDNDGNKVDGARTMSRLAKQNNKPDDLAKYLKTGIDIASASDNPDMQSGRNALLVDYNLDVVGDSTAAVKYKKMTMGENWQDNASRLNGFAWWCYENMVDLPEADTLARKAVELSEPGSSKAMILDTAAHICKARGNLEEAIKFMQMAVDEDPENSQWSETLDSFKAEMQGGS